MGERDDSSVDEVLSRLRRQSEDLPLFLNVFASKMASALPAATRVKRTGLFGTGTRVVEVQVDLGNQCFTLRRKGGGSLLEATRAQKVSGVVLETQGLALATWLHELVRALAAQETESGQDVLSTFLVDLPPT